MKERSNGSTAGYYQLPSGAAQLQDLISQRNMNAQIGEIFRACYRYGLVAHSDMLRDARKILFYAKAEVDRLEKLQAESQDGAAEEPCDPAPPADRPKLAVGQVWKDRESREVTIVSSKNEGDWPFRGDNEETYSRDGVVWAGANSSRDLIELIRDEHGWYQWKATKDSVCPVSENTLVCIRLCNKIGDVRRAGDAYWDDTPNRSWRIEAYKVM